MAAGLSMSEPMTAAKHARISKFASIGRADLILFNRDERSLDSTPRRLVSEQPNFVFSVCGEDP